MQECSISEHLVGFFTDDRENLTCKCMKKSKILNGTRNNDK